MPWEAGAQASGGWWASVGISEGLLAFLCHASPRHGIVSLSGRNFNFFSSGSSHAKDTKWDGMAWGNSVPLLQHLLLDCLCPHICSTPGAFPWTILDGQILVIDSIWIYHSWCASLILQPWPSQKPRPSCAAVTATCLRQGLGVSGDRSRLWLQWKFGGTAR